MGNRKRRASKAHLYDLNCCAAVQSILPPIFLRECFSMHCPRKQHPSNESKPTLIARYWPKNHRHAASMEYPDLIPLFCLGAVVQGAQSPIFRARQNSTRETDIYWIECFVLSKGHTGRQVEFSERKMSHGQLVFSIILCCDAAYIAKQALSLLRRWSVHLPHLAVPFLS